MIQEHLYALSEASAAIALLIFCGAMIWAGISDLLTMKIRNLTVLILLGTYLLFAPMAGLTYTVIGGSISVGIGTLAFTGFLFACGWIGGGDAKLIPAGALWVGASMTPEFLTYTALFGGVLTVAILQFRSIALPVGYQVPTWITRLHSKETGIPYGVAIAIAALVVVPNTLWASTLF